VLGGREDSLGEIGCPWNGLGSALIKCLICPRDLLCLKGVLFPGLHCIGIMQASGNVSRVGQYQRDVDRVIHSIKFT
jgi:hypothetical protein